MGRAQRTARIHQRDPSFHRYANHAHNAHEASDQERKHNLDLLLQRHLQLPQHRHGQQHGNDVSDCIQNAHDFELEHQMYATGFDRRVPCAADGSALEDDDEELHEAVGGDEGADRP